jgi:hypothetical protein
VAGQVATGADECRNASFRERSRIGGGWIDIRDLAQVLEHEGPLPHPAKDRPQ